MTVLHCDVESFSSLDLKKVGVENYVRAPGFAVTVFAWAFDDEPVQSVQWPHTQRLPERVLDHIRSGEGIKAWNAAFEWHVLKLHYGIVLKHEACNCVMQRSLAWGLPGSLQLAGEAIGAAVVKDDTARRLMLSMGKPRRDGTGWHEDRSGKAVRMLDDLAAYCRRDVDAERELDRMIPALSAEEKALSVVDAEINQMGVLIDLVAVRALKKAAETERWGLDAECAVLTSGAVTSAGTQSEKLLAWLQGENVILKDTTKETIAAWLAPGRRLHPRVRRVLEIRQAVAKSSLAKLDAMAAVASVADERARNLLQFYGAGRTGRWAGRLIQVQNLPRPDRGMNADTVIGVAQRDAGGLGMFWGKPMRAISGALRGCLVARRGCVLVSVDLSQIEARITAWLAGQEDVLQAFREQRDVYTLQAAAVGSSDRQLGKVLVLGCGYGMGPEKFRQTAAEQYGVVLSAMEAEAALRGWRAGNDKIVRYWYAIEDCVKAAVRKPGVAVWLDHGVAAGVGPDGVLMLRKPGGGRLAYHGMRFSDGGLVFSGLNGKTKKWGTERTYGGRLVENLVQGVARQVMALGITASHRAGWTPIMSVHDEIVWEVPERGAAGTAVVLRDLMIRGASWSGGLPLAAEYKISRRFGK
jgi:DNA polymerase